MTVEVLIKAIESLRKEPTKDPISEYEETRVALEDFRSSIGEVATAVSCRTNGKPLVVAIDELDRCRPTYAIELIETAKHIFLVENVVFILAVNSTALAHSVKSLYGAEFDAERYFRRFFDLQFRLPVQDRDSFAKELLRSTRLQEMIESQREEDSWTFTLARSLLSSEGLSLRDAEQVAHRLGLVLSLLDDVKPWTAFFALIGLSIMVLQPEMYVAFLRGESTDEEINKTLSDSLPFQNRELAEIKPEIEAAVIVLNQSRLGGQTNDFDNLDSPRIEFHRRVVEVIDWNRGLLTKEQQHSRLVLDHGRRLWHILHLRAGRSTLFEALQSLELLLPAQSSETE